MSVSTLFRPAAMLHPIDPPFSTRAHISRVEVNTAKCHTDRGMPFSTFLPRVELTETLSSTSTIEANRSAEALVYQLPLPGQAISEPRRISSVRDEN